MYRLRQEEEQRQYEQMLNPAPAKETFTQRFPNAGSPFGAAPFGANTEADEITYADINRQMALIINVLVSIIACSVAIWIAARRWEVHKRLALSMFGSGLVAFAEVAIYLGYIRRIKDAKVKERGNVERKEVVETWVIEGKREGSEKSGEGVRFRKGKHR
jgi:TMEM199 family protein